MQQPSGILTVGHGTASQEELGALLAGAGVELLVDIRTAPGSSRHPHVNRRALAQWLPARGIAYRWEPRLGGFRKPTDGSPDVIWRNASFRGYAGHMRSAEFLEAIATLLDEARTRRLAVMCSESLWWRCHRRLVADFVVVAHGRPVAHLMHDGTTVPHAPTPGVRLRDDGLLVYDGDGALPGLDASRS